MISASARSGAPGGWDGRADEALREGRALGEACLVVARARREKAVRRGVPGGRARAREPAIDGIARGGRQRGVGVGDHREAQRPQREGQGAQADPHGAGAGDPRPEAEGIEPRGVIRRQRGRQAGERRGLRPLGALEVIEDGGARGGGGLGGIHRRRERARGHVGDATRELGRRLVLVAEGGVRHEADAIGGDPWLEGDVPSVRRWTLPAQRGWRGRSSRRRSKPSSATPQGLASRIHSSP